MQPAKPGPRYGVTPRPLPQYSDLSLPPCPQSEYNEGACPELFASLQLCYQAGVFVSRSSLGLLKVRRVEVLSVLQLVNMLVWVLLPVVSAAQSANGLTSFEILLLLSRSWLTSL